MSEITGFRCLSINTDMSKRNAAAKGDKLFSAVLNIATTEVGTKKVPSFITIQEIGPRNGLKLVKHCKQYQGIVRPISYDNGVLMWRQDRWELRKNKDISVSEMGHYMSVKLYDTETEESVYLIGTHQVKEGRGFETYRTLNKHIEDCYRREIADNIVAAGDYNFKATNMSKYYPLCKYAFDSDEVKSSNSGCLDNVITPKLTADFSHTQIMTEVSAFNHKPVVALYTAKRELY